jgi:hypothetical protein
MLFYWGLWLFVLIVWIIDQNVQGSSKKSLVFFFAFLVILSVLIGGRIDVGSDWWSYYYFYETGFFEITGEKMDFLFQQIRDLLYKTGRPFGFFSLIISLISLFSLFYAIKKSDIRDCWLAFLVYLSISFCHFQLNVIRFGVLASLMLLGFVFKAKGEMRKGLLCILLGIGFHKSGFFFLLLYPFIDRKLGGKTLFLSLIMAVVFFFFGLMNQFSALILTASQSLGFDNYTDFGRWGTVSFSIGLLGKIFIWAYAYYFNKRLYETNSLFRCSVNLLFGVILLSLALAQYAVFIERIGNALSMSLMFIIPILINKEKGSAKIVMGSLFVIYLMLYYPLAWNREEAHMLPFITHINYLFM